MLLDFSDEPDPAHAAAFAARRLRGAMADGTLPIGDVVATAQAVLVQAEPGVGVDLIQLRARLAGAPSIRESTAAARTVQIPTVYDGADLAELSRLTGTSPAGLAAAHRSISWRVQFMGFAPGFGYLVPDGGPAPARALFAGLGRRDQSRPAVAPGSVAVAAGYSAVYPGTSPGGWFLLGHTDMALWDVSADPPALLSAGTPVRFTCAD